MIGKQAVITKDKQTTNGMIKQFAIVTVREIKCTCSQGPDNISVEDNTGRLYWVNIHDILVS